ncbi:MAG: DNA-binding protein [Rhodospirillaceae bacterium]|jgi:predicted nucleic acid-binding protein|nr:DNA-binding protein [Rhodospirillaceae bacterium]MBT6118231.1 DNA-binding protein [Rhodospirillaceae bacterium]
MAFSSSLTDDLRPLVLDTSVLINLHACTYGGRILRAVPNDIFVSRIVANELEHETSRKNGEHSFLHGLLSGGEVILADMTDDEYALFAELTSGFPSIDDGEAATIAVAAMRKFLCLIDEKKGRARAEVYMDQQEPAWSLDLLRHPQVVATLNPAQAADALYLALRNGRMRIPEDHCSHVVGVISPRRALECRSLPGYKIRRQEWCQNKYL